MLLRRVIAHLRKQEWTAIAIDFVIVVFGVFVGLHVNKGNAALTDSSLAALPFFVSSTRFDRPSSASETSLMNPFFSSLANVLVKVPRVN